MPEPEADVLASSLSKTFYVPEREPGLRAALAVTPEGQSEEPDRKVANG